MRTLLQNCQSLSLLQGLMSMLLVVVTQTTQTSKGKLRPDKNLSLQAHPLQLMALLSIQHLLSQHSDKRRLLQRKCFSVMTKKHQYNTTISMTISTPHTSSQKQRLYLQKNPKKLQHLTTQRMNLCRQSNKQ